MILFTKDSGGVVASVAALIATGWSDPLPGGLQLPLKNNAFSRRTGFSLAFAIAFLNSEIKIPPDNLLSVRPRLC